MKPQMPLVICLDGEGAGTGSHEWAADGGSLSLWGQFGDWQHIRAIPGEHDFTTHMGGTFLTKGDGSPPRWSNGWYREYLRKNGRAW